MEWKTETPTKNGLYWHCEYEPEKERWFLPPQPSFVLAEGERKARFVIFGDSDSCEVSNDYNGHKCINYWMPMELPKPPFKVNNQEKEAD